MPILILLAFIGVPLVEIALFIEVGGLIGLWGTIGVVIVTAAIGTWLLRAQGLSVLNRMWASLDENRAPVREVFDGVFLLFAGGFLLTPGFLTDTIGFVLFVPPARAAVGRFMLDFLRKRIRTSATPPSGDRPANDPTVIDGEFEELAPDRPSTRPAPPENSRWGRGGNGPKS